MACPTPYITKENQPVPCGNCPYCLMTRAQGWAFRLIKQHEVSECAWFVTLTYSNETVPRTKEGFLTLNRKHVKDYCKRLRQAHHRSGHTTPIKYYFVGEYGSRSSRPHYHAIIFNAGPDIIDSCWTSSVSDSKHDRVKTGNVHIDLVNPATICYTTKYLYKGRMVPAFKADTRLKEFSNMSKGLGLNYLTDEIYRYHAADLSRQYITLAGGVKCPLPRYFREKLYSKEEREQQAVLNAFQKLLDFETNVKQSGLSREEYAHRERLRVIEQTRLLRRREDLNRVKL